MGTPYVEAPKTKEPKEPKAKTPKAKAPKVKAPETVTYHKTHTLSLMNTPCKFEAILHPDGVQFEIDGLNLIPVSLPPKEMLSLEKRVAEDAERGYISDLVWGEEVTVTKDPKKGWVYVTPTE